MAVAAHFCFLILATFSLSTVSLWGREMAEITRRKLSSTIPLFILLALSSALPLGVSIFKTDIYI